jgi:hypothetical protein
MEPEPKEDNKRSCFQYPIYLLLDVRCLLLFGVGSDFSCDREKID